MSPRSRAITLEFEAPAWFGGDPRVVIHRPLPGWPLMAVTRSDDPSGATALPVIALGRKDPGAPDFTTQYVEFEHHIIEDMVGTRIPAIQYVGRVLVLRSIRASDALISPTIAGVTYHE